MYLYLLCVYYIFMPPVCTVCMSILMELPTYTQKENELKAQCALQSQRKDVISFMQQKNKMISSSPELKPNCLGFHQKHSLSRPIPQAS